MRTGKTPRGDPERTSFAVGVIGPSMFDWVVEDAGGERGRVGRPGVRVSIAVGGDRDGDIPQLLLKGSISDMVILCKRGC